MSYKIENIEEQQRKFDEIIKSISAENTFPTFYSPSFESVAETVKSPEERALIFFRECIHNAITYKKDKNESLEIIIYSYYDKEEDCAKFIIGTNATPFKNVYDVFNGCRPFVSKNEGSSVFGGGLKLAAYINDPDHYEIIIASHTTEDGFVSITGGNCQNYLTWKLSSLKTANTLSQILQDQFNKNFVYYLVRHPKFNKNYTEDGIMADLTWFIGDIIEKNNIKVRFLNRNIVLGNKPIKNSSERTYENINSVNKDDNRRCKLLSKSEYISNYCHKHFDYEIKSISHINDQLNNERRSEINYDVKLSLYAFPGFIPPSSFNKRTYELLTMDGKSYIAGMSLPTNHQVFIRFPCLSNSVFKKNGYDLYERMIDDSLYMGLDAGEFLTMLDLPRISGNIIYDSKEFIEKYSSLLNKNLISEKNTNPINISTEDSTKRKPFIIICIDIVKINYIKVGGIKLNLKETPPEKCITYFGGNMEGVFYLRNSQRCRKVIKTILTKLSEQITQEQIDYFIDLAPRLENECIPIEDDSKEYNSRKLYVYDFNTEKVINEFETNRKYSVTIRNENNEKMTHADIDIVEGRGHFLGKDHDSAGNPYFILTISKLSNEDNKKPVTYEQYEAATRQHGSAHRMLPRLNIRVKRNSENGKQYGIGKVIGVPKIVLNSRPTNNPHSNNKNKKTNLEYLCSLGNRDILCAFQEGKNKDFVILNKDNIIINTLFVESHCNHLPNTGDIKREYRTFNNIARQLKNDLDYGLNCYIRKEDKELSEKYKDNPFNYIIDKILKSYLEQPQHPLRKLKDECEKLIGYKNSRSKEEKEIVESQKNTKENQKQEENEEIEEEIEE